MEGKHTAQISNNTPFALVNHISYQSQSKYGLGKGKKEADKIAKDTFSSIFGMEKWILVNLTMEDYERAWRDEKHEWEDAVQYQCVLKAGKEFATDIKILKMARK